MGLMVRFCSCNGLLSSEDIREGRPVCKKCRNNKKIKIPPLGKVVRKPNPAPDLYNQMHKEGSNGQ